MLARIVAAGSTRNKVVNEGIAVAGCGTEGGGRSAVGVRGGEIRHGHDRSASVDAGDASGSLTEVVFGVRQAESTLDQTALWSDIR